MSVAEATAVFRNAMGALHDAVQAGRTQSQLVPFATEAMNAIEGLAQAMERAGSPQGDIDEMRMSHRELIRSQMQQARQVRARQSAAPEETAFANAASALHALTVEQAPRTMIEQGLAELERAHEALRAQLSAGGAEVHEDQRAIYDNVKSTASALLAAYDGFGNTRRAQESLLRGMSDGTATEILAGRAGLLAALSAWSQAVHALGADAPEQTRQQLESLTRSAHTTSADALISARDKAYAQYLGLHERLSQALRGPGSPSAQSLEQARDRLSEAFDALSRTLTATGDKHGLDEEGKGFQDIQARASCAIALEQVTAAQGEMVTLAASLLAALNDGGTDMDVGTRIAKGLAELSGARERRDAAASRAGLGMSVEGDPPGVGEAQARALSTLEQHVVNAEQLLQAAERGFTALLMGPADVSEKQLIDAGGDLKSALQAIKGAIERAGGTDERDVGHLERHVDRLMDRQAPVLEVARRSDNLDAVKARIGSIDDARASAEDAKAFKQELAQAYHDWKAAVAAARWDPTASRHIGELESITARADKKLDFEVALAQGKYDAAEQDMLARVPPGYCSAAELRESLSAYRAEFSRLDRTMEQADRSPGQVDAAKKRYFDTLTQSNTAYLEAATRELQSCMQASGQDRRPGAVGLETLFTARAEWVRAMTATGKGTEVDQEIGKLGIDPAIRQTTDRVRAAFDQDVAELRGLVDDRSRRSDGDLARIAELHQRATETFGKLGRLGIGLTARSTGAYRDVGPQAEGLKSKAEAQAADGVFAGCLNMLRAATSPETLLDKIKEVPARDWDTVKAALDGADSQDGEKKAAAFGKARELATAVVAATKHGGNARAVDPLGLQKNLLRFHKKVHPDQSKLPDDLKQLVFVVLKQALEALRREAEERS